MKVIVPNKFNIPDCFTEGERREAIGVNRGIDQCVSNMLKVGITLLDENTNESLPCIYCNDTGYFRIQQTWNKSPCPCRFFDPKADKL